MFRNILLFLFCILFAACGTHKHIISQTTGKKQQRPIKEIKSDIEYKGLPWVENISKPIRITKGLQNKHLSVWASHGKYYNKKRTAGFGNVQTCSVPMKIYTPRP